MSDYIPSMDVLIKSLSRKYANAYEVKKIILSCAAVAAGADAIGGVIPVISIPATIISCSGAVLVMYKKICDKLGIVIKEKVLKILSRAALVNITVHLGGSIAGLIAGMLIPGTSVIVAVVVSYLAVYLSGIVFLNMICKLAEKSSDPYSFSDVSEKEMKNTVRNSKVNQNNLEEARKAREAS